MWKRPTVHEASHNETEQPILIEERSHEFTYEEAAAEAPIHNFEPEAHEQPTAPEMHELTSVNDTGNMHSEPAPTSEHDLPANHFDAPSSPIIHETAVVDAAEPSHSSRPEPYFEPGSGFLEEEMLDDDDETVVPAIHAHTAADFDQQEHESLEHAADLGIMIREMSIDQITRSTPSDDAENLTTTSKKTSSKKTRTSTLKKPSTSTTTKKNPTLKNHIPTPPKGSSSPRPNTRPAPPPRQTLPVSPVAIVAETIVAAAMAETAATAAADQAPTAAQAPPAEAKAAAKASAAAASRCNRPTSRLSPTF